MNFEEISVLVPTYNRNKFLPLFLMSLTAQTYPNDKITLIIDDDGDDKFIKDIKSVEEFIHPIKLKYIQNKPRRQIGKKRNDLIKECKTKIFAFMDDDDIYFPSYLLYSYETLKKNNVGCVGSDKMLFCMTDKNFDIHMIDCGNTKKLIHEATIMMTKKWFNCSCKFGNNSAGEGKNLFEGIADKSIAITQINKIMCCVQHGENTIGKLQFARDDNKINIELTDDMKNMLKNILKIN
jgi:glycosyltransferase involved in cell wall biosynthesis